MAITITIQTETLTEQDFQILAALAALGDAPRTAVAEKAAELAARVEKATPPKAATKKPEPVVEDEPAASAGATMEDAVKVATKLVSEGEAKKVKATLVDLGANKVSELDAEGLTKFVAALS